VDHLARGEALGPDEHHDAVDLGEVPRRDLLVPHAVLRAEDREVQRRHRAHLAARPVGVERLHGQQQDVTGPEVHGPRLAHGRDLQRVRALHALEEEARPVDRLDVGRRLVEQDDRDARLGELSADHAADRPRSAHDDPHGGPP
jgi:hypothetical protein